MKEFAIVLAPVILNTFTTAIFTFIITRKIDKSSKQSKIIFEELENIATSLKKECEKEFARDAIIIEFCKLFEEYCEEKKII